MCFEIAKGARRWKETVVYKVVTRRRHGPHQKHPDGPYVDGALREARTRPNDYDKRLRYSRNDGFGERRVVNGIYVFRTLERARQEVCGNRDHVIISLSVDPKDFLYQGRLDNGTYRRARVIGVVRRHKAA